MDQATRALVRTRADDRCEYCRLHQDHAELAHHVEHIVAKKHGGSDSADALRLSPDDIIKARTLSERLRR